MAIVKVGAFVLMGMYNMPPASQMHNRAGASLDMPISAGTRLDHYEILSPLGAGGMGEVYRARDARLGRDIAIKVLPTSFSGDPERLRRFELEACAASELNHANILAIYDIGTHNGTSYIVSELLEGETLRDRLEAVSYTHLTLPTTPYV